MSVQHRTTEVADRAPTRRRLTFSTPLSLSLVAVLAVAIVAATILLGPRGPFGLGAASPSPGDPTPTASPSQPVETPTVAPTAEPTPPATTTPMSTPTPAPTSTSTPVPRAGWTGIEWSSPVTKVPVHYTGDLAQLHDLVAWGDGYVAGGTIGIASNRAALLTSPDGLHWTGRYHSVYRMDPGFIRPPRHLVEFDGRLLAFSHRAYVQNPDTYDTYDGPAIWESNADGSLWHWIVSDSWDGAWRDLRVGYLPEGWGPVQYDIETGLVGVASGPDVIVAIGNSFTEGGLGPVLLHSIDGTTWSASSLPTDSPSAILNTIVSHDDGFVIVGAVDVGPDPDTAVPAAWHSTDGLTWTRATVDDVPTLVDGLHGEFGPLVAGTDGLVTCFSSREMVGGGSTLRFADPWVSTDGTAWHPATVDLEHPTHACGWMASDGRRIVALEPRPTPGQPWPGITEAWVSTDGARWEPLALSAPPTEMLERFWVVPDGVIYAGERSFWFGTASDRD